MNDKNIPSEPPVAPQDAQPVAYDASGRPLYAHPPTQPQAVVHVARPMEPEKPMLSPETEQRHKESVQHYPLLNLSTGEYVLREVRRHPIGLLMPLAVGAFIIALSLTLLFNYDVFVETFRITGVLAEVSTVGVPILAFAAFVVLGMFISWYVYTKNTFYLTNESVIQEIQHSLFSRQEQTVSLANIEDASFTQKGILQQVLDYGDIRLSTEGDETTYRFTYVGHPKEHIARLNNAVEAFKNGRPVDGD